MCLVILFRFLLLLMLFKLSVQNAASYGIIASDATYPTTTCVQLNYIETELHCFYTCLKLQQFTYMFSHNAINKLCLCCGNYPGTDITSTEWNTYQPAHCPERYTTYNYTYLDICLLYVPALAEYLEASTNCKQNGGDLIKIDTIEKYTYFKEHLSQYTGNDPFQVWVQGVEDNNQQWRFHDGSLMPGHCLAGQSNASGEIHMRAMSTHGFKCHDALPVEKYHYMCEIYRVFPSFQ